MSENIKSITFFLTPSHIAQGTKQTFLCQCEWLFKCCFKSPHAQCSCTVKPLATDHHERPLKFPFIRSCVYLLVHSQIYSLTQFYLHLCRFTWCIYSIKHLKKKKFFPYLEMCETFWEWFCFWLINKTMQLTQYWEIDCSCVWTGKFFYRTGDLHSLSPTENSRPLATAC